MPRKDEKEVDPTVSPEINEKRWVNLRNSMEGMSDPVPLEDALKEAGVPSVEMVRDICLRNVPQTVTDPKEKNNLSYIQSYTFDFMDPTIYDKNPFVLINKGLLHGTPDLLSPVSHLIWGLLKALRSLTFRHHRYLYRGLDRPVEWEKDETRLWPGFTSTSVNKLCACDFAKKDKSDKKGKLCGTLICIRNAWGYNIEEFSLANEGEVLLEPGTKIDVRRVFKGKPIIYDVDYSEESDAVLIDQIPRKTEEEDEYVRKTDYEEAMKLLTGKEHKKGLSMIKMLSDKGNVKAMIKYGGLLVNGAYGETDDKRKEGFDILAKMKNYFDGEGLYHYAYCYEMGYSTKKDEREASRLYFLSLMCGNFASWDKRKLWEEHSEIFKDSEILNLYDEAVIRSEGKDSFSQVILGACFLGGYIKSKNEKKGVGLIKQSADAFNPFGEGFLGYHYLNGEGGKKELPEDIALLRRSADQNNPLALISLGTCYEFGTGVTKDPQEAFRLYRQAAKQGDPAGQLHVGVCYENGFGVMKNVDEAVHYYRMSVEQGYSYAQKSLGFCYEKGIGVEMDLSEAIRFYRLAVEQGNPEAQYNLGVCHDNGTGVAKDIDKAVKLYKLAADQGYAPAQYNLGVCYNNGDGVKKSISDAVKMYKMAADQGYASAQYSLAVCFEKGNGTKKDISEALRLYKLSAEQGYSDAKEALKRFGKNA